MSEHHNETLTLADFDREFTLKELFKGVNTTRLFSSIQIILGQDFNIQSENGELVLGQQNPDLSKRIPLCPELEPVGFLLTDNSVEDTLLKSVKQLIELILASSIRYLMASDLHLETVQSDFEVLKQEHEALLNSELRYKELAEHLEQRVAEQVKTIDNAQRQLYQAEKLSSVGQLAAGVAHEINNPIGFIKSNLSTSKKYINDFSEFSTYLKKNNNAEPFLTKWQQLDLDYTIEDFQDLLDESIQGAEKVTKIVTDLKEFSNVDHNKEEIADINEQLRCACNIANMEMSNNITLELHLAEIPKTRCQSAQLSQVFLNILLNAKQVIDDEGVIVVRSSLKNDKICIEISDNGPGIPESEISRVFDPFYTTKDVGEGTGLGLTVSRDIIMNHDGSIEIDTELGKGTTVRILLPIIKQFQE